MKMDYLFWVVAVLLLGLAAFRAARSPERPREGIVWLCGALIGIAADLPSHLTWGADAGRLGWSAAVLLQAIAGPLPYLAMDLTFPLWGALTIHVGLLGLWVVIALVGCLYHGPLAVWLGRVYRRRPARAVALVGGILVLHLCVGMLWHSYTLRHSQVDRQPSVSNLSARTKSLSRAPISCSSWLAALPFPPAVQRLSGSGSKARLRLHLFAQAERSASL